MDTTYSTAMLGGPDRNVEQLGTFVAWLVCNNLLAPFIENNAGSSIVRIRTQEMSGPEFLTTVLHGELRSEHLNEIGRRFTEHYFVSGVFDIDYNAIDYTGENEWLRYREISPAITAAFQSFHTGNESQTKRSAKILRFPFRRG